MRHFCIVSNSYKDENLTLANSTKDMIVKKGGTCIIKDIADKEGGGFLYIDPKEMDDDLECVITIGGDGTLLHTAKDLQELDVVFVGINKGRMGFLAEISIEDIEKAVDRLFSDDFKVESRMMLKGELIRDGKVIYSANVLNDLVAHRGSDLTVSEFFVYVNGFFLGQFNADGIIVATPTGSSAYSLSAGGPIARPESHMIILTPICPHSIAGGRSILLSRSDVVEIEIGKMRGRHPERRNIAFDGDNVKSVVEHDIIRISEAKETAEIAKLDAGSFLQTIKDKIL